MEKVLIEALEELRDYGYSDIAPGNDVNNKMNIDDYINDLSGEDQEDLLVVVDEYDDGTAQVVLMEDGFRKDVWVVANK